VEQVTTSIAVTPNPRQRRQAARRGPGGRRNARRVPEGIDVDVCGTYFPGSPGQYHGDPYHCFPADPEDAEVTSASWEGARIELTEEDEIVARAAILSGDEVAW